MTNRILIWQGISKGNQLDIFNNVDYNNLCDEVKKLFNGTCPNWGNKLWFQGLISEIQTPENTITFRSDESIDYINNNFDFIIYPMANFFGIEYKDNMHPLAETFSQIKIPTYIIACGAQAKSYDDLNKLVDNIGEQSKRFISSIYATGGEFALRGHFTKEFFNKLGFTSAVVTGCPSLFQLGRDFKVKTEKFSEGDFNPCFNGNVSLYDSAIEKYNSCYFDQDQYFYMIYDKNYIVNNDFISLIRYYHYEKLAIIKLLAENKLLNIPNMNDWHAFLKNKKFNYSFGSRIHGSIMAILAGIPSTVVAIDTRTQEMADFFDIPYVMHSKNKRFSTKEIYQTYLDADYNKFNENFAQKFDFYENFLVEHGIVKRINQSNRFFNNTDASTDFLKVATNTEKFQQLYNSADKIKPILSLASKFLALKNRII